jgi:hypothetical protein
VALALVAFALQTQAWAEPAEGVEQETLTQDAEQLLALANQARASQGAAPLKWNAGLAEAARQHCLRMAKEGPIAHRYGGEMALTERAAQAGAHFSLIEENVAVGPDAATIHDSWMHSPGHRTNMLNPSVDRIGVATVASRGILYAVADYARAVPVLTPAQVEAAIGSLIRAHGVSLLADAATARAACATERGAPTAKLGAMPQFVMRWQNADLTRLPPALLERIEQQQYHQAAVGSCPAQDVEGSFTTYRVAVLLY